MTIALIISCAVLVAVIAGLITYIIMGTRIASLIASVSIVIALCVTFGAIIMSNNINKNKTSKNARK